MTFTTARWFRGTGNKFENAFIIALLHYCLALAIIQNKGENSEKEEEETKRQQETREPDNILFTSFLTPSIDNIQLSWEEVL